MLLSLLWMGGQAPSWAQWFGRPEVETAARVDSEALRAAIRAVADYGDKLAGWALMVIAGSIVALVSTSYVRPGSRRFRLLYLLYLPGWVYLASAVRAGSTIRSRYLAALFGREENLVKIAKSVNSDVAAQQDGFLTGLLFFAAWLGLFLFYWVFSSDEKLDPVSG